MTEYIKEQAVHWHRGYRAACIEICEKLGLDTVDEIELLVKECDYLRVENESLREKIIEREDVVQEQNVTIADLTAQLEAAKGQGEPVYQVWCTYREVGNWEDVSEADYRLARDDDRRLLYTAPPTAALIRELTIRECIKALEENEQFYCRDTLLALIQQPSSLEEFGLKVAEKVWAYQPDGKGEPTEDMKSIVNEVMKGGV